MTAFPNRAKRQLQSGQLALGLIVRQARTVDIASIAEACGFDWLSIDMEHTSLDVDTAAQIAIALPAVDVLTVDLPHHRGHGEVLHLLSLISPLDDDLALVYLPLLPVRLVQLLEKRGLRMVEVPDEEFESMGCNVLALAPRVGLALDGNPETRRRLEAVGVEVRLYAGQELSRKGDGGPTCLTRPLARG